jgi:hypothetical protein
VTLQWFKEFLIDISLTLVLGAIVYCVMYMTDTTPEDIFGWVYDHIPSITLVQERPKYL